LLCFGRERGCSITLRGWRVFPTKLWNRGYCSWWMSQAWLYEGEEVITEAQERVRRHILPLDGWNKGWISSRLLPLWVKPE